jgi:2-succinyl-6-hydroxy-2,4-cyclohexadiene-1-carboxylate synthase
VSKLAFISWGEDSLPPLILLHGFMGSAMDWSSLAEDISSVRHCIAPDLPGHGRSLFAQSRLHGIEATVDMIAEMIRLRGYSSVELLGYSLGGRVALSFALRYPRLVRTLILESSSPGIERDQERFSRQQADSRWQELLQHGDMKKFISDWYAQPLFSSLLAHPNYPELKESRMRNKPIGLQMSLKEAGTGAMKSLWQHLPQIHMPVHLMVGEKDWKYRIIANKMMERLPAGSLHMVQGSGHNIHFEAPLKWLEHVRKICMK